MHSHVFMAQGYYCTHTFPCKSSTYSHFVLCIPMCSWLKATTAHMPPHVKVLRTHISYYAFPCVHGSRPLLHTYIPMCSWVRATTAHMYSHVFMGQGNYCTHAFPCVHGSGQLLHRPTPMYSWLGALYYSECIINKYFLVRLLIKTLIFLYTTCILGHSKNSFL